MAKASIWLLSVPLLVRCRMVTLVIRCPVRVSWICMGPYWVLATAPVIVRVAAELPRPGCRAADGVGLAAPAPAPLVPEGPPGWAGEVVPGALLGGPAAAAAVGGVV